LPGRIQKKKSKRAPFLHDLSEKEEKDKACPLLTLVSKGWRNALTALFRCTKEKKGRKGGGL